MGGWELKELSEELKKSEHESYIILTYFQIRTPGCNKYIVPFLYLSSSQRPIIHRRSASMHVINVGLHDRQISLHHIKSRMAQ